MSADPARLRALADLLDDDEVFDVVAGLVADARDRAPRHPEDRDSAELLTEVIGRLRGRS